VKIFSKVIDLFFPRSCFSCSDKLLENEEILCNNCKEKLKFFERQVCDKCGFPLKSGLCEICKKENYVFDKARSVFSYEGVIKDLIHHLKYDEKTVVVDVLAEYIENFLKEENYISSDYIFVPVPLHSIKKKMRGYNQAEVIANSIAKFSGNEVRSKIITRNRFTESQTKLGRSARIKNLKAAFNIQKDYDFSNKKFLIIDDVFTTGTTVNEIAMLLKHHQAQEIRVLTIARAKT